jgi:hypothetical protein
MGDWAKSLLMPRLAMYLMGEFINWLQVNGMMKMPPIYGLICWNGLNAGLMNAMMKNAKFAGGMMMNNFDYYQAGREARREAGEERREKNLVLFREAAAIAKANGFELKCLTDIHYQIILPEWKGKKTLINIYPGNQRIYITGRRKFPRIEIEHPWNLIQIVNRVASIIEGPSHEPVQG